MSTRLTATVRNGQLVLDDAVALPEGTVVDLTLRDDGDTLSDDERARLHEAIEESLDQAARGEVRDAGAIVSELQAKRT